MSKRRINVFTSLLFICISLQFMGCSVIGSVVGTMVDNNKPDQEIISIPMLNSVVQGKTILVTTKFTTVFSGEYIGLENIPTEEYRASYDDWRTKNGSSMFIPTLGDTILLSMKIQHIEGQFMGFNPELILLKLNGDPNQKDVGPVAFYIRLVDTLSSKYGNSTEGKTLQSLIGEGDVPFASTIALKTSNQTIRIPLDEIKQIKMKVSKKAALTGFLVGAMIDAVIVVGIIASHPHGIIGLGNSTGF